MSPYPYAQFRAVHETKENTVRVFMVDNPKLAECLSDALHRWCSVNSRCNRRRKNGHPKVFSADGLVAEKPNGQWLIRSAADVPNNVIKWAAAAFVLHLHSRNYGLARRSIRGALAYSHARLSEMETATA